MWWISDQSSIVFHTQRSIPSFGEGMNYTCLSSCYLLADIIAASFWAYNLQYIHDSENLGDVSKAFLLLGLLVNYNKFETRNPYKARFEDFVNQDTIEQIVRGLGTTLGKSRDRYVALQEDVAVGWTLSSTLTYIGLGILAPVKPAPTQLKLDAPKADFADL